MHFLSRLQNFVGWHLQGNWQLIYAVNLTYSYLTLAYLLAHLTANRMLHE